MVSPCYFSYLICQSWDFFLVEGTPYLFMRCIYIAACGNSLNGFVGPFQIQEKYHFINGYLLSYFNACFIKVLLFSSVITFCNLIIHSLESEISAVPLLNLGRLRESSSPRRKKACRNDFIFRTRLSGGESLCIRLRLSVCQSQKLSYFPSFVFYDFLLLSRKKIGAQNWAKWAQNGVFSHFLDYSFCRF